MASPLSQSDPTKAAVLMAGAGHAISFGELESKSARLASLFHKHGLEPGSHIAILLDNDPEYFPVCWAAQRSGIYYTPVNFHLTAAEAGYIVENSGATVLISSRKFEPLIKQMEGHLPNIQVRLSVDEAFSDFVPYAEMIENEAPIPASEEEEGSAMFYSSGTTGYPKGIRRPLSHEPFGTIAKSTELIRQLYKLNQDTIYLSPAPLYHAAPLSWAMAVQRLGGTVVVMEKFDASLALHTIGHLGITHAQFVPTHFIRLLKLPPAEREQTDTTSLKVVVHAAAPCPKEVKQQMLAWIGPKIYEYYAGSEGVGFCAIGPEEWLAHPGSVGRSLMGKVHVLSPEGVELAAGESGQIWFEAPQAFQYHNDKAKTEGSWHENRWSTYGDIGHVDDDGYIYLTDRVSNMIISGGVNIYPQEVENVLSLHPSVFDVAIIGIANPEMGEEVQAVVQPALSSFHKDDLARELIEYCRSRLSHYKCPRSVRFVDELPRLPSGKLAKRFLNV